MFIPLTKISVHFKGGAGKFAWGGNVPENEDHYERDTVEIFEQPAERKSLTLGDFMGY